MNKSEFIKQLKFLSVGSNADTTLLSKWFSSVVKTLGELHRQKSSISHIRHRGDAHETDLINTIEPMFPADIKLAKGFLVGPQSSVSREQDILVLDGSLPTRLMGDQSGVYHISGAALASIEVKSKLNLDEIRKAILNCMSAKGVVQGFSRDADSRKALWYAVFAYSSQWNLSETAEKINREIEEVPDHLRPDGVYVLGGGLILPGSTKGLEMMPRQRADLIEKYVVLGPMGTDLHEKSEAYPFLWFIYSIITHCLKERANRTDLRPFDYFLGPLLFQSQFERAIKRNNPELFAKWLADAEAKREK